MIRGSEGREAGEKEVERGEAGDWMTQESRWKMWSRNVSNTKWMIKVTRGRWMEGVK